ncbi:hypothetical protein GALL_261300 [mine drainage metagenome]|uniref:Uncharacterized protein n=1 Tax=mine drainage metagenome TaxID=410659 RepID=A0A1J5R7F7_9ZZZZ
MSLMCKMNGQCSATKGMCIHEKMMAAIAMIAIAGAVGHWVLHWF